MSEKYDYGIFIFRKDLRIIDNRGLINLSNKCEEIIPIFNYDEKNSMMIETDEGVRKNQTIEDLSKLKPYFDKITGTVTVGNSSQITDGASMAILMSESKAKELGITPPFTTHEANMLKNSLPVKNAIPWNLIGGVALTVVVAVVLRKRVQSALSASREASALRAGGGGALAARSAVVGSALFTNDIIYPAFVPVYRSVFYSSAPGMLGGFMPNGAPYFFGPRGGVFQIINGIRRYM